MYYEELLKIERACPFCDYEHNMVISKNDKAFLTYSIAPYCKHHLLVIPKRHVIKFEELTKIEKEKIDDLLSSGISKLNSLGHTDYSILVRTGKKSGKSIEHLHYHIIPSIEIGSLKNNHKKRIVMTQKEINKLMKEFKNIKKSKIK